MMRNVVLCLVAAAGVDAAAAIGAAQSDRVSFNRDVRPIMSDIKKGLAYGATDDLGYAAVDHPVSVHDFHATMLHLLGIDASKLAVKYQGLDVRLTGPEGGAVVPDLIA